MFLKMLLEPLRRREQFIRLHLCVAAASDRLSPVLQNYLCPIQIPVFAKQSNIAKLKLQNVIPRGSPESAFAKALQQWPITLVVLENLVDGSNDLHCHVVRAH